MNLPLPDASRGECLVGDPGPYRPSDTTNEVNQPRSFARFGPSPLPDDYLESILRLAAQVPAGSEREHWRFIVVREAAAKERLSCRGTGTLGIDAAPVVVIAFTLQAVWPSELKSQSTVEPTRIPGPTGADEVHHRSPNALPGSSHPSTTTRRQNQMALTTMILVAEAYGVAAAPVHDFDPGIVRGDFGLPPEADIVALMALGFSEEPMRERNASVLPLHELIHVERYGCPWVTEVA